jgi:RNA polymerase sigma-70 factor (ECF subfamily)
MQAMSMVGGRLADEEALFASLYPALFRLACVVCPPEGDPDDLVQDATARALRRGPLTSLEHPKAYLRRSIVNLASNERRRLGRQRRAVQRLDRSEAVEATYASDLVELRALSPTTRAVLWLAEVEGAPYAEIGEQLGMSEDAARTRAARARAQLRHLMEGER